MMKSNNKTSKSLMNYSILIYYDIFDEYSRVFWYITHTYYPTNKPEAAVLAFKAFSVFLVL